MWPGQHAGSCGAAAAPVPVATAMRAAASVATEDASSEPAAATQQQQHRLLISAWPPRALQLLTPSPSSRRSPPPLPQLGGSHRQQLVCRQHHCTAVHLVSPRGGLLLPCMICSGPVGGSCWPARCSIATCHLGALYLIATWIPQAQVHALPTYHPPPDTHTTHPHPTPHPPYPPQLPVLGHNHAFHHRLRRHPRIHARWVGSRPLGPGRGADSTGWPCSEWSRGGGRASVTAAAGVVARRCSSGGWPQALACTPPPRGVPYPALPRACTGSH